MQTPQKGPSGLYEMDIDGKTFAFTRWPLRVWLDRYIMFLGLAGEFVARLIAAADSGEVVSEDLIARMAEALMRNLGKDRVSSLALIEALCSDLVFVDGKKINFSLEFKDNIFLMHRVCAAAVAVQYGPLFGEAKAYLEAQRPKQKSAETTSSEASGQS